MPQGFKQTRARTVCAPPSALPQPRARHVPKRWGFGTGYIYISAEPEVSYRVTYGVDVNVGYKQWPYMVERVDININEFLENYFIVRDTAVHVNTDCCLFKLKIGSCLTSPGKCVLCTIWGLLASWVANS